MAQRRSYFKGLQRLLVLDFSRVDFNVKSTRKPEVGDIKDRSIELPLWPHASILYRSELTRLLVKSRSSSDPLIDSNHFKSVQYFNLK